MVNMSSTTEPHPLTHMVDFRIRDADFRFEGRNRDF
jgi:hypothetical protein